jgi:hypothetical protein
MAAGATSHTRPIKAAKETVTVNRNSGRENFSSTATDETED